MPYTICVNRPGYLPESDPTAVATLDEAKAIIDSERDRYYGDHGTDASEHTIIVQTQNLPITGGTIGPLPDGYIIDVQRLDWIDLARLCGMDCGSLCAGPNQSIIDVYNGS